MPDSPYLDSSLQTGLNDLDVFALKLDTQNTFDKILNTPSERSGNFDFFKEPEVQERIAVQSGVLSEVNNKNFADYLSHPDAQVRQLANSIVMNKIKDDPYYNDNIGGVKVGSYNPEQMDKFLSKDYGYRDDRDNEDFYYRNDYMQDGWFKRNLLMNPMRFIGRVAVPAVLKMAEGLGNVGAMITSVGSDNYWADVADNGMSKWFEGLETSFKDQVLPVYKQAGFNEKGFFSKLVDWSFWNESVADGVAFMASAAIPAMGLSKIGGAGRFAAAFSEMAEQGSLAARAGRIASGVGLGSGAELTSWTFNTAMEAASEGAGVFKEMTRRMREGRRDGDERYINMTDDDIRSAAGQLAGNTVAGNFAVLALSNAWENTLFFKPLKNIEGKAALQLGEDFGVSSRALTNLEKKGGDAIDDIWHSGLRRSTFYGKKLATGFVMEGLWEENAQLAIQRMNQGDDAHGNTGFGGFFSQYGTQIADAFAGKDPEAAESIGLGALIGMGASTVMSKMSGERKEIINNTLKAVAIGNAARDKIMNVNDIYIRDDKNGVIFKDGKPQVDAVKLAAKQKALTDVFQGLAFANRDDFFKSPYVEMKSKKALANYVRSMTDIGITDVSKRFRNLDPKNATLFSLNPAELSENTKDFAGLADTFERHSNEVASVPMGVKPTNVTEKDFSERNEQRKSEIYRARTENAILDTFINKEESNILKEINRVRTLESSSIADFPIDSLNMLLQQKKSNDKFMADKDFEQTQPPILKDYHKKRASDLDKQIEEFKKANESLLQGVPVSPNGFYMHTLANGKAAITTAQATISQRIAEYTNTKDRNEFINQSLSDKDKGWANHEALLEIPALAKAKALAAANAAKQATTDNKGPIKTTNKYAELVPGDFEKVTKLVAKMVFSDKPDYSAEELQLQQNYAKLIEEMLPEYEGAIEKERQKFLNGRLSDIKKQQIAINSFLKKTDENLKSKKTSLDKLEAEFAKIAEGNKADRQSTREAIEEVQKDVDNLENTLATERDKLEANRAELQAIEDEVKNGNFRKLYDTTSQMREDVRKAQARLTVAEAALNDLKRMIQAILEGAARLVGLNMSEGAIGTQIPANLTARKAEGQYMVDLIKQSKASLNALFQDNRKEMDSILSGVSNYFRSRYISQTGTTPLSDEDIIAEGLTQDKNAFPKSGVDSQSEAEEEKVFDGENYLRPLHMKFLTTTFGNINLRPYTQDELDSFAFNDYISDAKNAAEIKKKLGKAKVRAIIVTRNNLESLGLEELYKDKKQYFDKEAPEETHMEVVPVIDDAGVLYYTDKNLNKLNKVGEGYSPEMIRRSLRLPKFTEEETKGYLEKYKQEDLDTVIKTATDSRTLWLEQTGKEPKKVFDFAVTRGTPHKAFQQNGLQMRNPVQGIILPEGKIPAQSVRIYSDPNVPLNGENIVVPAGRPFIYTTNGIHEQLHYADNTKLAPGQVAVVQTVMQEMMRDHTKRLTDIILNTEELSKKYKDAIEKAGGINALATDVKRRMFLDITKHPASKGVLFNSNYTIFLGHIIHFSQLEKGKKPAPSQVYIKGYNLILGNSGIVVDITSPDGIASNPDVTAWLSNQFHNIKYHPNAKNAERPFGEYFLKDGKLGNRRWENYATYLLAEKNPDGTEREVIPVTTSIWSKEQHAALADAPPYQLYDHRSMSLRPASSPITKKTANKKAEVAEQDVDDATPFTVGKSVGGAAFLKNKKKAAPKTEETIEEADETPAPKPKKAAPKKTAAPEKTGRSVGGAAFLKNKGTKTEEAPEEKEAPKAPAKEAGGRSVGGAAFLKNKKPVVVEDPEGGGISSLNNEEIVNPQEEAYRVSTGGVFKTEEDLDAVVADIKRMLPQFPVERLKKAIKTSDGRTAWGQFVNNTIKIYETGEAGTGYHEAFEAVVNKLLTDAEWNAISKEFRGRKGSFKDRETGMMVKYNEANDHQAKEELAEDFMRFKQKDVQPKEKNIGTYFRMIWDFVKKLFGQRSAIDDVFNRIESGKFADVAASEQNRFFSNYRLLPQLAIKARRELFEGATASMFKYLFYTPESLTALDEIEETDDSLYGHVRADFEKTQAYYRKLIAGTKDANGNVVLKPVTDDKTLAAYNYAINNIQTAIDNWDEFKDGHKKDLKKFRIRFETEENSSRERQDEDNIANRNDYVQDMFKVDGKRSASRSIRFLFGTLLRLRFDPSGTTTLINGKTAGKFVSDTSDMGMRGLVGYDRFMLMALEEFGGLNDFNKVQERMEELAGMRDIEKTTDPAARASLIASMDGEKAVWTSLYARLFGESKEIMAEAAWNLKVKFQSYIAKQKPIGWALLDGGSTSSFVDNVKRPFFETIVRKIESSIVNNAGEALRTIKQNGMRFYIPIEALAHMENKKGEITLTPKKINITEFTDKARNSLVKFLGLQEYINDEFLNTLDDADKAILKNHLLRIRNALTTTNTDTLNIRQLNISGYTENVILFLDKHLNVGEKQSQVTSITGEMRSRHVTPSFASRVMAEINSVATLDELHARFPQTATMFASDSIILGKLFDAEGNRDTSYQVSLDYMDGLKDLQEQEGTPTAKLEFNDKYHMQFNASLSGLFYTLPADSETEWLFNFGELVDFSENMMEERGDDIISTYFLPKLATEIDMARSNNSRLLQLNQKHASTGMTAGDSLRFFKNILSRGDKTLLADVHQAIKDKMESSEVIGRYQDRIFEAIRNYINEEVDVAYNKLVDNRLMAEDAIGVQMRALNNTFINRYSGTFRQENGLTRMTKEQARSLVEFQKINSVLAHMEQFKLIFGDPAQYKDWEKRAKPMFSPVEQTFNDGTNTFNNWLTTNKNKAGVGDEVAEIPTTDVFYQDFSDEIRSRTVEDFEVTNVETVNDLRESMKTANEEDKALIGRFIEDYEKTNEADGQSIGTIGFARHLMIKSGWRWTRGLEAYYQYDTALMRQELSKTGQYTYTSPELRTADKATVEYYTTNQAGIEMLASAVLTPVKTLMPSTTPDGAQILLKHSIYFLSYQVAKDYELLDRYLDMLKNRDDVFNFRSAQKVGLEMDDNNQITPYYADTKETANPFVRTDLNAVNNPQQILDMRTVGIQVETQGSKKGQTLGSQLTKLINLNLLTGGLPTDFARQEGETTSKALERWNALSEEEKLAQSPNYTKVWGPTGTFRTLSNLKTRNTLDTFNKLGVKWKYDAKEGFTYEVEDLTKIETFIHDELRRLEVDENTVNNIQLTEDKKAFVNPAETVPSYTTISNLLWSMADQAVTSMKVNGKSLIQVSSAFFNKKKEAGSFRTASYKNEDGTWTEVDNKEDFDVLAAAGKKMVMTSSDLKFYRLKRDVNGVPTETLGMEVYLPHQYREKVNKKREKLGLEPLSDVELMEYLTNNPKLLEGIGFRIPTQATSSIEMFTIKGFLPESFGSAVVVPSGITTKAGSDFDVDKLNSYFNNWKLNGKGLPIYEEFKDDTNSTLEERYISYIKEQEEDYKAIADSMKEDAHFTHIAERLEANEHLVRDYKDVADATNRTSRSIEKAGFNLFTGLPRSVQQQYFDRENELRSLDVSGAEKTLNYLKFTQSWIEALQGKPTRLPVRDADGISEEVVDGKDVIPVLESMIENYKEYLNSYGVNNKAVEDYLKIKEDATVIYNDTVAAFRLMLTKLVAESQGLPSLEEFKELPLYIQNTKGAVENQYFQSIRNVLKDPAMFPYLLSPNSVDHIKNNRNEVQKALDPDWKPEEKKELDYTKFLSTEYIAEKRNQFTKGKYDIGIFAVAMTNLANSQVSGISISDIGGIKKTDASIFDDYNDGQMALPFEDVHMQEVNGVWTIPISVMRDASGALTMDKISAYINGAVDVAKDPLIVEMGMHSEFAGVYTLMERMGLTGKTTALFLYQPIIREYLRELLFLGNKSYFGQSGYESQSALIKQFVAKTKPSEFKYDPNYKLSDEKMVAMIRKAEVARKKGEKAAWTAEEREAQYYAFVNYLKLKMYSNHLLESIQGSNHDTSSIRSPHILTKKELQKGRSKTGNMVVKVKGENDVQNGTEALRENTSVGTDINMFNKFASLFSRIGLFALQSANPKEALRKVAERIFLENPFMSNDDFIKTMREYETGIIDFLASNIRLPATVAGKVVYNELHKYAKQWFSTKSKTGIKSKYAELKEKYAPVFKKNEFLSRLDVVTDPKTGLDTMELRNKPGSSDITTRELITEGMMKLASYDTLPDGRKRGRFGDLEDFYKMVVYGAYIQFGIRFSRKSFLDLIPVSLITDKNAPLSVTDITAPALQDIESADLTNLGEQIQRTKWYRNGVVPEKLQRALQFIRPNDKGEYVLDKFPRTQNADKPFHTTPRKTTQVFFSEAHIEKWEENGEEMRKKTMVSNIHPTLIWAGKVGSEKKWEEMANIIKIPGIRPEYVDRIVDEQTNRFKYIPSKRVWDMIKKGDHSYIFYQLYKKVGVEDKSLARAMITKNKAGEENISYLYKPINKYGTPDFNETIPVSVTDNKTVVGTPSIVRDPAFTELEDNDLVNSINSKQIVPIIDPDVADVKAVKIVNTLKPLAAKNKKDVNPEC